MSLHLLECAARRTDLPASTKLVLMCLADDASKVTRIAFPGLEEAMVWSGLSRSRCLAVIGELVDDGLVGRHKRGHRGRRAEFIVFPGGCCAEHPTPPDDEPDEPKGSRGQDSPSVIGSGRRDPVGNGSDPLDPVTLKGSGLGLAHGTPPSAEATIPPSPATASRGCRRHPITPGANCRRCGTSPRALARAAEADDRAADLERRRRDDETRRLDAAATAARLADPAVQAAIADARAAARGALVRS